MGILFKKVFLHKLIMMSNFNEINLNKQLQNAIDDLGFQQQTPIQQETYSKILAGQGPCRNCPNRNRENDCLLFTTITRIKLFQTKQP